MPALKAYWYEGFNPTADTSQVGNVMSDLLDAVREGRKQTEASFEYGARLTEFTLLANLAQHAGVGKKIEWDGPNMKVTNFPDLNQWLQRPYRKGWPA
jgi:hypothetical protein